MKKIILSILFTLQLGSGIAQFSDEDLQRRYFLSRDRLKKWFVSANSNPGGGFPIENIILGDGAFSYPFDRVLLKPDGTDSIISNDNWNSSSDNAKNTEASGVKSCEIIVERDSQKRIVVGSKGAGIKQLGIQSRKELEAFFGKQIFIELFVKVRDNWRNNANMLKQFGYEGD